MASNPPLNSPKTEHHPDATHRWRTHRSRAYAQPDWPQPLTWMLAPGAPPRHPQRLLWNFCAYSLSQKACASPRVPCCGLVRSPQSFSPSNPGGRHSPPYGTSSPASNEQRFGVLQSHATSQHPCGPAAAWPRHDVADISHAIPHAPQDSSRPPSPSPPARSWRAGQAAGQGKPLRAPRRIGRSESAWA
jgi:hypothetical protein